MSIKHAQFVLNTIVVVFAAMGFAFAPGCASETGNDDSASPDDDAATTDDDAADDDTTDDDSVDDDTQDDDAADDDTGGCVDFDGDGYGHNCPAGEDCWDYDPDKWEFITPYRDADYDMYPGTPRPMCAGMPLPNGWSMTPTDCDDADPAVNPGMFDFPDDGIDNDCAGGDVATSSLNLIFVDGAGGDDANPGTAPLPMKTINAGVAAATLAAADGVVVAYGTYNEDVVTTVSLFGGYEAGTWTRDLSDTGPVTRVEPVAADTTILVDGATGPIAVHGFTIQVPDAISLARGVAVEDSGLIWVGTNSVGTGTADTVVGIASYYSDTSVIANNIHLGEGGFSLGIQHEKSSNRQMISSITANTIDGVLLDTERLSGIDTLSSSVVISNKIDMTLIGQRFYGIRGGGYAFEYSTRRWAPTIAKNDVKMSGGGYGMTAIRGPGSLADYISAESVVENEVRVESDARGAVGINAWSTSGNRVKMHCSNLDASAFSSGECIGIESELLGVHRQNQIWIECDDAPFDIYGIRMYEHGLGLLLGAVVDNTVFITATNGATVGVYADTYSIMPFYSYGYLYAEFINNNIVTPPSGVPLHYYADYVDVSAYNNNLYFGDLRDFEYQGFSAKQMTEIEQERRYRSGDDLSVDPLFVDAANGDLRLRSDSPLIDAGAFDPIPMSFYPYATSLWNEEWNRFPADFDGTWRPQGAAMDIGADEYAP